MAITPRGGVIHYEKVFSADGLFMAYETLDGSTLIFKAYIKGSDPLELIVNRGSAIDDLSILKNYLMAYTDESKQKFNVANMQVFIEIAKRSIGIESGAVFVNVMKKVEKMQVENPMEKGDRGDVETIIMELNDRHLWTFDQIADWLDTLDRQPTVRI